jgi:hypothetical protein
VAAAGAANAADGANPSPNRFTGEPATARLLCYSGFTVPCKPRGLACLGERENRGACYFGIIPVWRA